MIKIDSIKDLQHIDKAVRYVIEKHLERTGQAPTNFANEVGIHPLQMLRYVNESSNFRIETLIKIGKNTNTN